MADNGIPTVRKVSGDLSQLAHRRIIGVLGFFLPVLLYLVACMRPTEGLARQALLDSVSAYYYTGAVGVFVGVLFSLSLFLFTYRGYVGESADRIVGAMGGAGALMVALFPTTAPDQSLTLTWWTETTRHLHYAGAAVLFGSFILFAVWLFRKSNIPLRRDRPPDKRRRDAICLVCGLVMIVSVIWTGFAGQLDAPIFVPEAIAIMAFAVSWLVKGEAHTFAIDATKSLVRRIRSA